jgi:hypothetical protein
VPRRRGSPPASPGRSPRRRCRNAGDLLGARRSGEPGRLVADDDHERSRGRQRRRPDRAYPASREAVSQLGSRCGTHQPGEGRRGVELPWSRQVRDAGRDRSAWSDGGDIDPVDDQLAEVVRADEPPRRSCGLRPEPGRQPRATSARSSAQPCRAGILRVEGVDFSQGDQEHGNAQCHGHGRHGQADGCFPATVQGQPQAHTDHQATRPGASELTMPSRTTTSRSA